MAELLEESGSSTASSMAAHIPSPSSALHHLRPPETAQSHGADPLELNESDVLWSYAAASPPSFHHVHRFNPWRSGLSSALYDDRNHLIRRKSALNHSASATPPVTLQEAEFQPGFRQSAPVNIPLWPKEFAGSRRDDRIRRFRGVSGDDDDDSDDDGRGEKEIMVPPHVIVAQSHVTFSVCEGVGRTLKGRDLRRVRNAVLRKTGFID